MVGFLLRHARFSQICTREPRTVQLRGLSTRPYLPKGTFVNRTPPYLHTKTSCSQLIIDALPAFFFDGLAVLFGFRLPSFLCGFGSGYFQMRRLSIFHLSTNRYNSLPARILPNQSVSLSTALATLLTRCGRHALLRDESRAARVRVRRLPSATPRHESPRHDHDTTPAPRVDPTRCGQTRLVSNTSRFSTRTRTRHNSRVQILPPGGTGHTAEKAPTPFEADTVRKAPQAPPRV